MTTSCLDLLPNWRTVYSQTPAIVQSIIANYTTVNKAKDLNPATEWHAAWQRWLYVDDDLDFSGCHSKQQWAPCNGIHDALIQQLVHAAPKFSQVVIFSDDYAFYQSMTRTYRRKIITWDTLDDIIEPSYFVVSWPNHRGMLDDGLARLLAVCQRTGSRIFLDCAFFGTISAGTCDTGRIEFDAVAFSVSKAFLCGGLRAGIVFGDDLSPTLTIPSSQHFSFNYYNVNSVSCGTEILNATTARTIPDLFRQLQLDWCIVNQWEPADIVLFALNSDQTYSHLWRHGSTTVRACLTDYYIQHV